MRVGARRFGGAFILQSALLLLLAGLVAFIVRNVAANAARFDLHMGMGFPQRGPRASELAMHPIAYSAQSSYGAARFWWASSTP